MPIEEGIRKSPEDVLVAHIGSADDEAAAQARNIRRQAQRESWNAYWKIRDIESRGTLLPRISYWVHKTVDAPVTWFRESVSEPLQDKYRWPYYHRQLDRVPSIDECGVNDLACIYEANEQYRLDKAVDTRILGRLRERMNDCLEYHTPDMKPCSKYMEDYEENEINYFIKYGELGYTSDVRDAYMKQKHRMIWERRHPEIMAERDRLVKEHKELVAKGIYDHSFWKRGSPWDDKKNYRPPYDWFNEIPPIESETDQPISKDWQYYKQAKDDPTFDPDRGNKGSAKLWPWQ